MKQLATALLIFCGIRVFAQQTFPIPAPSDVRSGWYALTGATVFTDYQTTISDATLIIREGNVVSCTSKGAVPTGAVVVDCSGKIIYPGFIDLYAEGYGLPAPKAEGEAPRAKPQMLSNKKGPYAWNEALKTDFNAWENLSYDEKSVSDWRKIGFSAVLTHREDGISMGSGALVSLADLRPHESVLMPIAAHHMSFRKGTSTQDYPASLMGAIALLRQTYLDGQWYRTEGYKLEKNASLEAWNALQSVPQIFNAGDKLNVLRAARIAKEFQTSYLVKTNGDEYQRLEEIKSTGQSLIVPVNFPVGYKITDPLDEAQIDLRDLKHWELAPSNPARLEAAGISFALTSAGLKAKEKFLENLRKAVEYGLSETGALKALTYNPAMFIKAYGITGSLEPGKVANFIVTSGNIFQKESKILSNWCQGEEFSIGNSKMSFPPQFMGEYSLIKGGERPMRLFLSGKPENLEAYFLSENNIKTKVSVKYEAPTLSFWWVSDSIHNGRLENFSGVASGETGFSGVGKDADGQPFTWAATLVAPQSMEVPSKPNSKTLPEMGKVYYPFKAYGWEVLPSALPTLVKNVTVWTSEKEGILQQTDVLFAQGKIVKIGKNLDLPANGVVIDGTGKHLTAGIIDEHSHIAVSGSVNEGTQESSAEVRLGDVIDSEDADIYRQLAGGVTTSHILHGSANPIGGQTQLIKLRWGAPPEGLKFENWPGYIKFALGENVKQSNWGDDNTTRYPQTRMGVEQTYEDYFSRARTYADAKKAGKPMRRDLDLEALEEILEGKRFITCHSYVQSEINMLMHVADRFGFRVNTFTHILEGYKVADKMAKHGAGASTFSDWWAYKYEVMDAIPQNAAIMQKHGIVVSINSDDAEMARRLNQEAAKSVMYGGMSEADAWKMVTINPAKLLRVDSRVGSILAGKDADLVLWSDNPLSVYARAEKTWVDGVLYFDRAENEKKKAEVAAERRRLVQKVMAAGVPSGVGEKPSAPKRHHHCDDLEE